MGWEGMAWHGMVGVYVYSKKEVTMTKVAP